MKNKNFLIIGSNFYNKGAQLMLLSLIDQLKIHFPEANLVVSPLMGKRADLENLGLKILDFPLQHVGGGKYFIRYLNYGHVIKLLKKGLNGDIAKKDIDVIFDISGFAYGDQWGAMPASNLALLLNKVGKKPTKLFLMPQAFGPFSSSNSQSAIKSIIDKAVLLFARDKISFSHLTAISGTKKNILMAPDITLTFHQNNYPKEGYCCIVPNERMLDKASEEWNKEIYLEVFGNIISKISNESAIQIKILVHDNSGGDKILAKSLYDKFSIDKNINLVQEEDAAKLKAIIAKSNFIVGSRFHALASSLSSSVPCLAISWSHKYQMLFDDFGLSGFVYEKPENSIYNKLNELLIEESNEELRTILIKKNQEIKHQGEVMWNHIKEKIDR